MSRLFPVSAGVRQGGVLSPLLFAVYMDNLIDKLESSGYGCRIHGLFMGCVMYADDIILLAQSSTAMQEMLNICNNEVDALNLKFNVSKSVVLRIGPRWKSECAAFLIGSVELKFVQSCKYLGIYVKSGSVFSCSYEHLRFKFYSSFNAVYARSKASVSETVTVELMKSFCLPLVTYGLEATFPNKSTVDIINNMINRAVFKIFNVTDKMVIHIRCNVGLTNMHALYAIRQLKFLRNALSLQKSVLRMAMFASRVECRNLFNAFDLDIDCSIGAIYRAVLSRME